MFPKLPEQLESLFQQVHASVGSVHGKVPLDTIGIIFKDLKSSSE